MPGFRTQLIEAAALQNERRSPLFDFAKLTVVALLIKKVKLVIIAPIMLVAFAIRQYNRSGLIAPRDTRPLASAGAAAAASTIFKVEGNTRSYSDVKTAIEDCPFADSTDSKLQNHFLTYIEVKIKQRHLQVKTGKRAWEEYMKLFLTSICLEQPVAAHAKQLFIMIQMISQPEAPLYNLIL
ncbi:MAG: hypothetical protein P0S95_00435 [Rhabdochlamydiaceae bacterium]|nr:hypothetical protein [Candidatus Amphrikana amoebophyrae]